MACLAVKTYTGLRGVNILCLYLNIIYDPLTTTSHQSNQLCRFPDTFVYVINYVLNITLCCLFYTICQCQKCSITSC